MGKINTHGIVYFKTLKAIKKKKEKVRNWKLGDLGNLGNHENIIPSFRFYPTAEIENSDLEKSEKKFIRFSRFPSFRPGLKWLGKKIKTSNFAT